MASLHDFAGIPTEVCEMYLANMENDEMAECDSNVTNEGMEICWEKLENDDMAECDINVAIATPAKMDVDISDATPKWIPRTPEVVRHSQQLHPNNGTTPKWMPRKPAVVCPAPLLRLLVPRQPSSFPPLDLLWGDRVS
jgi:hypothetical protein